MNNLSWFRDRFPYTKLNDINLDWILKRMKELSALVVGYASDIQRALSQSQTAMDRSTSAVNTANTAASNADIALDTANSVSGIAEDARTIATAANNTALDAETVASGIAETAQNAFDTARSAESAAESARDSAENAQEIAATAVQTANSASARANNATQSALTAISTADSAQQSAGIAAQDAEIAQQAATAAAQNAETAQQAAEAAAAAVQGGTIIDTVFGNGVSFSDGMSAPCKKLVVDVNAVQSGSGTPSPTNIRPISGWTRATVSSSGEDTSNPTETVYSFPSGAGTVYGGTLTINDDGSGELIVDKGLFAPVSWSIRGTENVDLYARIEVPINSSRGDPYACTVTPPISSSDWNRGADGVTQPGANLHVLYMKFAGVRTTAGITEIMNSGNVFVLRKLINPVVYPLTAQQVIDILDGTNNIWADCGELEVTYTASIRLYIQKINAPTNSGMIADSLIANRRFFIVGGTLYRSTANIIQGNAIIPGSNCNVTNLAEALNSLI